MSSKLSPRYGHVRLDSGYIGLTGQLTKTWISNSKKYSLSQSCMSLSTSSLGYGCHLHDSTVVIVVVVNTRPRAIPLAMITMRKSIHGFPSVFYMGMGLRFKRRYTVPWLNSNIIFSQFRLNISKTQWSKDIFMAFYYLLSHTFRHINQLILDPGYLS